VTGDELRAIRQRLGLTQVEFAERLGIASNSLARQERGVIGISGSTAKLAQLLLELAEKKAKARPKRAKKK
jgi:transcriptional regulator with XRE-family HTH domain